MLIRFYVENFLSFTDEVEFSMVAGESDEHPDHVTKDSGFAPSKRPASSLEQMQSGKVQFDQSNELCPRILLPPGTQRLKRNLKLTIPFLLDSEATQKTLRNSYLSFQCGIADNSFEAMDSRS